MAGRPSGPPQLPAQPGPVGGLQTSTRLERRPPRHHGPGDGYQGPDPDPAHQRVDDHPEGGLRRILDTVSDEVRLGERDGASWVTLTKQVNGSGA